MRLYPASAPDAPLLVLGHGAGAGHDHPWMVQVAQGLADRGVHVVTFDFPYKAKRKSVPDPAPLLEAAFAEAWVARTASNARSEFHSVISMLLVRRCARILSWARPLGSLEMWKAD